MAQVEADTAASAANPAKRVKLTGRAFYESIGSPKMIVAPMVDRSEFAWRLLTRSYMPEEEKSSLLAYSPMFHARLFSETPRFRDAHFQPTKESLTSKELSEAPPFLDGNPQLDRPLFVQFCANKPEDFLESAQYVAPYCDAVDLNLGCPQGIAKSGHYGAFLQEDWDTIHKLIRRLRDELDVPVTAKFRRLETKEQTLDYAKMLLDAGASIITLHGRERHQKGHNTGLADWTVIRYLRDNLPPDTVLFANGNILNSNDIQPCLDATGADGIMSAEGNLSDPTIFAKAPEDQSSREYWRDPETPEIGGYRIDAVFRRYLDIIHRYVLEQEPPQRKPLYLPGHKDETPASLNRTVTASNGIGAIGDQQAAISTGAKRPNDVSQPAEQSQNERAAQSQSAKKQKKRHNKTTRNGKDLAAVHNPNLKSMQGHLFQLLRPMISEHIPIRDALARCRAGDIAAFENVLSLVEDAVRRGLDEEAAGLQTTNATPVHNSDVNDEGRHKLDFTSSEAVRERCRRPFWVCQPHIRPLPDEAFKLGAMTLSKKEKEALTQKKRQAEANPTTNGVEDDKSQAAVAQAAVLNLDETNGVAAQQDVRKELPRKEGLACG